MRAMCTVNLTSNIAESSQHERTLTTENFEASLNQSNYDLIELLVSYVFFSLFHDKGPSKAQMKAAAITIQR